MFNSCECEGPGFCERYQRDVWGRDQEICRNENVDIGQAAQIRLAWIRDAKERVVPSGQPAHLHLVNKAAPGDVLVMTAAIHSLHAAYPGQYTTSVETTADDVFLHNPLVIPRRNGITIEMHYPLIDRCNSTAVHFMQGYCNYLAAALDAPIPLATNRPMLYFDRAASTRHHVLVNADSNRVFSAKAWGLSRYQKLVDLCPEISFVQVGHDVSLSGVRHLRTTFRELFDLCRTAVAGIGPITLLQHAMAACEKPYICLAGGREPVQWISYPKQHTLHTIGMLPCCRDMSCWKSTTVECTNMVDVPRCMANIEPEQVATLLKKLWLVSPSGQA